MNVESGLRSRGLHGALLVLALSRASAAAPPTKEECIDAHGRGQDQQEAGHLALARDSFAVCSQPTCPALVQSDCAEFSEQLSHLSPSVSFAARDQAAADLPDTQVYVDGALVAQRLDEGRSYDIDPGHHSVRFIHGERNVVLNVVINQGEHGRNLIANFVDASEAIGSTSSASSARSGTPASSVKSPKRPVLPLIVAVAGGAALATGGVLMGVGFGKIPGNCSLGSHECTSAPGDPAFSDAQGGVTLVNAGLGTAIAGAVLSIGGLVWYFAEAPTQETRPATGLRFTGSGFVF